MTKQQAAEQAEAIEKLQAMLKPGDTVYCILRSVSSSGMSRVIDLVVAGEDKTITSISWLAARAMQRRFNNPGPHSKYGIRVNGCGMDMGFELVYSLGYRIFPNGFTLPEGERGRNGDTSGFDKDGGYALRRRWL